MSTLQERLQGLVDESKTWTTHMEREKSVSTTVMSKVENQTQEIVLRGRGGSTTTNNSEDPLKKLLEHPKVMMRVAMTPEGKNKQTGEGNAFIFLTLLFSCSKTVSI